MAEEKPQASEESETKTTAKSAGKGNMLPIAAGAIVFVVSIVIFSLQIGVFSSDNVAPQSASSETAAEQPVDKEQHQKVESEDSYSNLFAGLDEEEYDSEDGMTEADSLQKVTWYEAQKQEIQTERARLESDGASLRQLRAETEALLERRAALEDSNVSSMAKLYENMKTEELIPILSNLDDSQVSLLIGKMKKQKASSVLGSLPPERAARITQWLISLESN